MRKVSQLKIEYDYINSPESKERADQFYSWLVNKAIDNLLKKQKDIDNNSTQKYTGGNGQSRDISNPRRGSRDTKSQKDHNLSHVSSWQAPSREVWQGLENKQKKINDSFGG